MKKQKIRCHICGEVHKQPVEYCASCRANLVTKDETRQTMDSALRLLGNAKHDGVYTITDQRFMWHDSNLQRMKMGAGQPFIYVPGKGGTDHDIYLPLEVISGYSVEKAGLMKKAVMIQTVHGEEFKLIPKNAQEMTDLLDKFTGNNQSAT